MSLPVPIPKVPVSVREATLDDVPFLDALQKKHGDALGYFPTKQFEGYIAMGAVLVAEDGGTPIGYCISRDRYLKRDELGVIYQLCVSPGRRRGLVGAALVREVFARSAYGCRLYCCWCAQDLEANCFWESLGFVPLAFRTGSERKKKGGRVHIFWQKRIVEGDHETKWWYPFQTNSGAIRQDRIVFPIPAGTHWRDVRPVEIPDARAKIPSLPEPKKAKAKSPLPRKPRPALAPLGGFRYQSEVTPPAAAEQKPKPPKAAGGAAAKIDPKYLKAARELRDRWLERVNAGQYAFEDAGKYDVSRALPAGPEMHLPKTSAKPMPLLPAA
jgi:ribosomal protein S18 acetylase RimI-like enzyme